MISIPFKKQKLKKWTAIVLAIMILIAISCFSAYAQSGTSGAISIWHFNENHGCTISDEMGINTGKLKPHCPSNSPKWVKGGAGYALEFNGVDDYVEIPYTPSLQPLSFTIESWIKVNSYPVSEPTSPFTIDNPSRGPWTFGLSSSGILDLNVATGSWQTAIVHSIPMKQWVHIAGTFDDSSRIYQLFVNGELIGSKHASGPLEINHNPIKVGRSPYWRTFFNGTIDEVYIYNQALTPAEIKTRYQKEVSIYLEEANRTSNASSETKKIVVRTNAQTITVCPSGCDYNAIGLAIDAANDGDTVYVHNGTYNEHLRIEKPITLKGEGRNRVVITGNDRGTCTYITADNVNISGFTMENCGVGVLLAPSSNTNITNNIIQNTGRGIELCGGSNNNLISGNIIQNNGNGISLIGGHKTTFISKNTITSNSRYGIYLIAKCYVTIMGNNISQNKEGIYIAGSSANISSNFISASTHGIYIVSDLSYINNVIFNNTIKSNGEGIHIKSRSTNNKISFNTFQYNQKYDIYLDESAYNHITSNKACNIYNTETNTILNNTCQREDSVTKKTESVTNKTNTEEHKLPFPELFLIFWLIITAFFGLILLWLGRGWRIREDEIMSISIMSIKALIKFGLSAGILLRLYTVASILWGVFWIGTCIGALLFSDSDLNLGGLILVTLILVLSPLFLLYIVLLYIVFVRQKQRKVREMEAERGRKEEEKRRREKEEKIRRDEEEKERKIREFESKKKKVKELEYNYIKNFVKKYREAIKKYREAIYGYKRYVMGGGGYNIEELWKVMDTKVFNELFYDATGESEYPIALKNLRTMLSKKGIDFSKSEIGTFINEELERQEYEELKNKLLQRNPKDVDDYVRLFLECYGEAYSDSELDYLQTLLIEKNECIDNLKQKIKDIKKEIELECFEKRLIEGSTRRVTIQDIDSMSGYDFERFLRKLFKKMGYSVTHTKLTGDQGGDLIISKFGDKIAVQAKRSENPIGNRAVQEVLGAIKMYNCSKGMVVTNNDFTTSTRGLAIKSNVELVGRNKLKDWIKDYM